MKLGDWKCFLIILAVLAMLPRARAAGAPIPHGSVELVAENQWIARGGRFYLGLHFQLENGWHIYWINPGDSGEAPTITWQLPGGITAGQLDWPAPRRLGTSDIVDFGYTGSVMLLAPMRASGTAPAQPAARIGAEMKVLVCREICVPGKVQLSLSIPIKRAPAPADDRTRELFSAARKSLPVPAPPSWKPRVSDAKDSLILSVAPGTKITEAFFFPLVESQISNSAPQKLQSSTTGTTGAAGATGFDLTLRKSDELVKPLQRLKGVLVVSPGNQAYAIDAPVGSAASRN